MGELDLGKRLALARHLESRIGPLVEESPRHFLHRGGDWLCLTTCSLGSRELLIFLPKHWPSRAIEAPLDMLWELLPCAREEGQTLPTPWTTLDSCILLPPPVALDRPDQSFLWAYPIHGREARWVRDYGPRSLLVRLGHLDTPIALNPDRLSVV